MCELVMGQEERVGDLGCRAKLATIYQDSCFGFSLGFGAEDEAQGFADAKQVLYPPELKPYSSFLKEECHKRP